MEYSDVAMVGDQLFTDILGGNLVGMTTVWLDNVPGETEGWITRNVNRRLERLFRNVILAKSQERAPYL
jgi:predicted HAD superfamily phosphohydrolase YqeG